MGQPYLNAFHGPMRAEIDKDVYSNALLKNDVQRLPQTNRAQDLEINRYEQVTNQDRQTNARKFVSEGFSALAQSQDPIKFGQTMLANPSFQAAMKDAGLDVSQFTIDPAKGDTAETISRSAMDHARMLGAQSAPAPVGATQFDYFAKGLSPQDRSRAQRIELGLDPRAVQTSGPDAPSGYRPSATGLEPIPGGPADPNRPQPAPRPTEGDKRNGLMYDSMVNAEKQIMDMTAAGNSTNTSSKWDALLGLGGLSVAQSDDYKKYEAAGLRWAANTLYMKSGATATPEEIRSTWKQYFPQPGDGPDVIRQKDTARLQEMLAAGDSLGRELPPQLMQRATALLGGGGSDNAAPEGTIVESQDGRKMVKRNGQWVPQ